MAPETDPSAPAQVTALIVDSNATSRSILVGQLREYGVVLRDLPLTPEKVLGAMSGAKVATGLAERSQPDGGSHPPRERGW